MLWAITSLPQKFSFMFNRVFVDVHVWALRKQLSSSLSDMMGRIQIQLQGCLHTKGHWISGHSYQHTDVVSLVILCSASSFTSRMHLTTGRIDLHYIFSVACICLITYFNTVISVHVCMSVCKKALITLILLNFKYTFLVDGKTVL